MLQFSNLSVFKNLVRSDDLKCQLPIPVSSDMKGHICNFSLKTVVLKGVLKKFKGKGNSTSLFSFSGILRPQSKPCGLVARKF